MRPEQFDIRSLPFAELVQDVVRLNEHDRQTLQSWLDSIERKGGRPDQKTEERLQHLQTRIDFIGELAGRLSCLDYCLMIRALETARQVARSKNDATCQFLTSIAESGKFDVYYL